MLKVELGHHTHGMAYASYDSFSIGSEKEKYQLRVSGFSAGDPNPGKCDHEP